MSSCFRNFWQCIQECKNIDNSVENLVCAWDCQVDLVNCISSSLELSKAESLDMVREIVLAIKVTNSDATTLSGGASVQPLPPRTTPTPTPVPTPQPVPAPTPGTPTPRS